MMEAAIFTERDLFILCHLTHTNAQIARMLSLPVAQLKMIVSGIYAKLGVQHRTRNCGRVAAIVTALEQGLIQLDEISDGDRPCLWR